MTPAFHFHSIFRQFYTYGRWIAWWHRLWSTWIYRHTASATSSIDYSESLCEKWTANWNGSVSVIMYVWKYNICWHIMIFDRPQHHNWIKNYRSSLMVLWDWASEAPYTILYYGRSSSKCIIINFYSKSFLWNDVSHHMCSSLSRDISTLQKSSKHPLSKELIIHTWRDWSSNLIVGILFLACQLTKFLYSCNMLLQSVPIF